MLDNKLFIIIFISTAAAQFLVVHYGGQAFKVAPLTLVQWGACVVCFRIHRVYYYMLIEIYVGIWRWRYALAPYHSLYPAKHHTKGEIVIALL
jgi:hypothetical protein